MAVVDLRGSLMAGKNHATDLVAGLMLLLLTADLASAALAQEGADSRSPDSVVTLIHVVAWPGGKKIAVGFALFVEEFGFGQGPVYRPDLASRNPDLVNEAFRQYVNRDSGHPARRRRVQGVERSAHDRAERRISGCAPVRVEANSVRWIRMHPLSRMA